MQRRAAAVYVAFFLVIAVGAYGYAATAESPEITVENPDHELSEGDEFEIDGTTYRVASLGMEESGGGGHGGGGGAELAATVEWNTTTDEQEEWEQGQEVDIQNTTYEVVIPNETDPTQFTLREAPGDDLDVRGEGDERIVIVQQDNQSIAVPIDEYQGLERQTVAEGDTLPYEGQEATVGNVTEETVPIEWTEETTDDIDVHEGDELDQFSEDQTYIGHFPNDETLYLTSDLESYNDQAEDQEFFHQRTDGLTIVTILSALTGGLLLMLAYLPRKE